MSRNSSSNRGVSAKQSSDLYNTTWTAQDRSNWMALGAFIFRMRMEGKIGKATA